jgi:uncharacterized protein YdhG (YjbR/CyaY superfamily)
VDHRATARTIDDYIAGCPPDVQELLQHVRNTIKAAAPEATETMSYGLPTFDLGGRHLVHFAAFKNHIGLYPTPSGIEAFEEELRPYKSGRGSVQFPLDRPLPLDLIARIVEFRVLETTRTGAKRRSTHRPG